jgi:hypothetical protein
MVQMATDRDVTSCLITNGLKLAPSKARQLIDAGLDLLEVSLDANTRETYAKIRASEEKYDRVTDNIRSFVRLRDEMAGSTYTTVSIIQQPKAMHEVDDFVRDWSEIVDDVVLRRFHDFMGFALDKEEIELPKRHPCRCMWSRFNVNSEGLASICFNDWDNQDIVGDLNDPDTTIASIWQSLLYDEYRQSHLDGKPKGMCATCNDWIGASWTMPYEMLFEKAKNGKKDTER